MATKRYSNICAVSKACEILEPRWTLPILNQIWTGYTRFNDIQRAVGGISPGVLSKRLAEMEANGLIERIEDRARGMVDYIRTPMAIELEPAINEISRWAQRNIEAQVALEGNSVPDLMWTLQKRIAVQELPSRRVVIRFNFTDETGPTSTYWLVHEPGSDLELCVTWTADVDLYIETTLLSMNALYFGRTTVAREAEAGRMFLSGDTLLERSMERWLPRSIYADVEGVKPLRAAE